MKKNLRIVSAAAAALLAVAPVAASGVVAPTAVVSADTVNATNSTADYSHINLGGAALKDNTVVNVNPSFVLNSAVTKKGALNNVADAANVVQDGSLTGSISANALGVTATANLIKGNKGETAVTVTGPNGTIYDGAHPSEAKWNQVVVKEQYTITVNNIGFNFGANNAGKDVTLTLPKNTTIKFTNTGNLEGGTLSADGKTLKGKLNNNGTVNGLNLTQTVKAFNPENNNDVVFYDAENGTNVKTGNVMVLADYNNQLNVDSILQAIASKYTAMQRTEERNGNVQDGAQNKLDFVQFKLDDSSQNTASEITKQLEAAGIKVSPAGYFTAPHSFNVTVKATSDINGKSAELPVTFTVANVADPVVPSQSKTIMHNAYYYDKDAKRVGTDKVTRYNTVTVAMNTTKLANGISYYEVIENGKATGKFINADNIDGTKRTLKHNAYVYRSSKKRANKVVLKKGETVTTYGGSYTFKNGKQYYKIGNNTEKTYVKASNF